MLNQCHAQLGSAMERITGARSPEGVSEKDVGPKGVNGFAMHLRNSAVALRQRLEEHINSL